MTTRIYVINDNPELLPCLVREDTQSDGSITRMFCAVGRFEPWPPDTRPRRERTEARKEAADMGLAYYLDSMGYAP